MKAAIVGISLVVGLSMGIAAVVPTVVPAPALPALFQAMWPSKLPPAGLEPLLADETSSPRAPKSFTATLNLAAMHATVISFDGEYFVSTFKDCQPGYCQWAGQGLGDRSHMTFIVARDGLEGQGSALHSNGGSAGFFLDKGKAWMQRSAGPDAVMAYCGTGLEEAWEMMGARALERMALASSALPPGR